MPNAICGNCGVEYSFPENIHYINCACGAKIFRPKEVTETKAGISQAKEEKPPAPPKEEKTIKKKTKKAKKKEASVTKKRGILDKLKEMAVSPKKEVESKLKELDAPPPRPENLKEKLMTIQGIAEKVADEICEEYDNIDKIKQAIQNKSFSVGGVGFFKKRKILNML